MRIQFDIDDSLWQRVSRYVRNPKLRHHIGRQALEEWVNRREGRDKKLRKEQLICDKEALRPLVQDLLDDLSCLAPAGP